MIRILLLLGIVSLACSESKVEPEKPFPISNSHSLPKYFPSELIGVYFLERATLQGPPMEVTYGVDPIVTVVYSHNEDITGIVGGILFNSDLASTSFGNCPSAKLGVVFNPNGQTSYSCQDSNYEIVNMGFWNTTGADNSLLAWTLFIYPEAIECEIVPYEASNAKLEGFLVFPLPKNGTKPFMEDGNRQYRKIKIILRKS